MARYFYAFTTGAEVVYTKCVYFTDAGLASRHTGDQSPKGVFFMADCKGALNRASLEQGSNEPLHPLKVSNERGFWGIERYAVPV